MTVIEEELGWEKGELQKMLDSEVVDSEEERDLCKLVGAANVTACKSPMEISSMSSSWSRPSTPKELQSENEAAVLQICQDVSRFRLEIDVLAWSWSCMLVVDKLKRIDVSLSL